MLLMSRTFLLFALLACSPLVLAQSHPARAQSPTPDPYKIIALEFRGSARFTSEEISAATGLKVGSDGHEEKLQQVLQLLSESGMFRDMKYTGSASYFGKKVVFLLADEKSLYPLRFDNFVWLSEADLLAELKRRVPFFQGQVPGVGHMSDQVAEQLEAILKEKGVQAGVEGRPEGSLDSSKITGFLYTVKGVHTPIRRFQFSGAGPALEPILQQRSSEKLGRDYSVMELADFTHAELLPIYQRRGYLRATFSHPQTEPASSPENAVTVRLDVEEGRCYSLQEIRWEGNTALDSAKLQTLVHLKAGEPANLVQLKSDMNSVHASYKKLGYLDALARTEAEYDDPAAKVTFRIVITEGKVYHYGPLLVEGLSEDQSASVQSQWQKLSGAVADPELLRSFTVSLRLMKNLGSYKIQMKEIKNSADGIISMQLLFSGN
jgi:outer membrane protein assembly factor BamA